MTHLSLEEADDVRRNLQRLMSEGCWTPESLAAACEPMMSPTTIRRFLWQGLGASELTIDRLAAALHVSLKVMYAPSMVQQESRV